MNNKITYRKKGDYLIPNLYIEDYKKSNYSIGKYGRLRLNYLKEHKRVLYTELLLTGKLSKHLALIDEDAKKSDVKIVYQYEAKTPEGKFVKGTFEGFSKVEVHSYLLSLGYEVYKIKTSRAIQMLYGQVGSAGKIKTKDLIFFLTQLSTYIKAGIPLVEALKILTRQYKKKSYQKIFKTIIYDLTMGDNFSVALPHIDKQF